MAGSTVLVAAIGSGAVALWPATAAAGQAASQQAAGQQAAAGHTATSAGPGSSRGQRSGAGGIASAQSLTVYGVHAAHAAQVAAVQAVTLGYQTQWRQLSFARASRTAARRAELAADRRHAAARAKQRAAARAAASAAQQAAAQQAAAQQAAAQQAAAQQAAAQQAAAEQKAAAQKAASRGGTAPAAPSGSPQQIAMSMLSSYGWSASQFSCLDQLWNRESGWNVSAANPSSGAYGIPQALPGSKMASAGPDWQTDAATQIRWGLGYIQQLYGSPCGAWSHEESTGWY